MQVLRTGAEQEQQRAVLPAVDVFEDAGRITPLADMPRVSKEQPREKIEGDALPIEGGVQGSTPEGLEAAYAEVGLPRYRRSTSGLTARTMRFAAAAATLAREPLRPTQTLQIRQTRLLAAQPVEEFAPGVGIALVHL